MVLNEEIDTDLDVLDNGTDDSGNLRSKRWICPKCSTVFTPMDEADATKRAGSLMQQKTEHEDYHFALDLQVGDRNPEAPAAPSAKVRKKPPPKKPEGIKAFFSAKPAKTEPA